MKRGRMYLKKIMNQKSEEMSDQLLRVFLEEISSAYHSSDLERGTILSLFFPSLPLTYTVFYEIYLFH